MFGVNGRTIRGGGKNELMLLHHGLLQEHFAERAGNRCGVGLGAGADPRLVETEKIGKSLLEVSFRLISPNFRIGSQIGGLLLMLSDGKNR